MNFNFFGIKVFKRYLIVFCSVPMFCVNAYPDEFEKHNALEWQSPIPRFQDLKINPDFLYHLVNEKITLLVYPEKNISIDVFGEKKTFNNARLVSAITVIDAPVNKVKDLIKDYASYTDVMPRTEKATIIQKAGRHSLVEYLLVFKLPVMAVKIKYVFQYTEENNGDISIRLHEGGGEQGASRWEFIPLSNGQTLLVFTTWNNLENSGYFFKTIVEAQPDLKTTIPEVSATLAVDAIKNQFIEGRNKKLNYIHELKLANKTFENKLPQTPVFNIEEKKVSAKLSEYGLVLVLHPKQNFRTHDNEIIQLEYISLIKKNQISVEGYQSSVLDFDSYPKFLPPLNKIDNKKTDAGFKADWYLQYKFGIFTLPVKFSLDYIWLGKETLYFYLVDGDFESFYGSFNWYSLDAQSNATFFEYSLAINIGDDLPFALKVLKKMPRQSLLSGLFMGTSFVEPQSQWLETEWINKK